MGDGWKCFLSFLPGFAFGVLVCLASNSHSQQDPPQSYRELTGDVERFLRIVTYKADLAQTNKNLTDKFNELEARISKCEVLK
tara:strand:- start:549 stop:797 length:249 start_codon:yes stop_codon:yes gene_type:complete